MDLRTKDGYGTKQPKGMATTLLDLVSRDDQDTNLFPNNATTTRFTRNEGVRTIPMASVFREFTFTGPAEFGQTFLFNLEHVSCGDLIQGLYIQIRLGDWLPAHVRESLRMGFYEFQEPMQQWTYSNSLGSTLSSAWPRRRPTAATCVR